MVDLVEKMVLLPLYYSLVFLLEQIQVQMVSFQALLVGLRKMMKSQTELVMWKMMTRLNDQPWFYFHQN